MKEKRKNELEKAFKAAFPYTIPVLTGFMVLGMAYGILMQTKGFGIFWPVFISALAFCGSMQFVAISLLTAVFNPVQAFLLSLMVNARHLFYGLSMLDKYKGLGKIRYFLIYTLCDETFSISYGANLKGDINRKYFYFFISVLDYSYWVLGTFLGAVLGNFLSFNTTGMDFVLTALFVVLFIEQMENPKKRVSGIIGIGATIVSLFVFGSANLVIPAMLLILSTLILGRKELC